MKKFNVCLLTCENAYICRVNESMSECYDTKRGTFCTLVREAEPWRKKPYSPEVSTMNAKQIAQGEGELVLDGGEE